MTPHYRFGLLGRDIGYSKSPQIFEAIFAHLGIEGSFDLLDVTPGHLPNMLEKVRQGQWQGISVTIPYKQAVIDHLDRMDEAVRLLQAVNAIAVRKAKLHGFNTDCDGFSQALQAYRESLRGAEPLILGNGGGARAAVYSLVRDYRIKNMTVVGRDESRLNEMRSLLESQLGQVNITVIPSARATADTWSAREFPLIVNCTPLGGPNHADRDPIPNGLNWQEGSIYYDLNYNVNNRTVAAARRDGLIAIDGSTMLVGQALRSFELWTGERVPFEPIYDQVFGTH